MIKRLAAVLVSLLLLPLSALCDIAWPDETPAQQQLHAYISRVNDNLTQLGQPSVNRLFECYSSFAVLGMASSEDAFIPEGVEMTFTMGEDDLQVLQLRVSQLDSFAALAASCIQASCPEVMTLQDALSAPTLYMQQALNSPADSFEDTVDSTLGGPSPRMYYAYYPNEYSDGVNWLQMTLVFPLGGTANVAPSATLTPPPSDTSYYDDNAETGYEGYDYDGGNHLEIFTTATPEPDSAANE
ncbi:MAG: hypothetical protein ACI4MJ_07185 [Aristaeellaceae bacterium]